MKKIDSIVVTGTNKYNMMLVLGHNKKVTLSQKRKYYNSSISKKNSILFRN